MSTPLLGCGGTTIEGPENTQPIPRGAVAASTPSGITMLPPQPTPEDAPLGVIGRVDGADVLSVTSLALDGSGLLYVASRQGAASPAPSTILVLKANGFGADVASTRAIRGPSTGLDPVDIAADGDGNLYVLDFGVSAVAVFSPDADGDVAPARRIQGPSTKLDAPVGIALDAAGALYVSNGSVSTVCVYAKGADGDSPPVRVIGGGATGIASPAGLAVDTAGYLFVSETSNASIRVFAPEANGDVAPARVIQGPATKLVIPAALRTDDVGRLYVASYGSLGQGSDLLVFSPKASLDEAPLFRFTLGSPAIALAP